MYTGCIIRMTITMSFNSVIYTVVITIQLTASINGVQCELLHPEATTDPPGLILSETTTLANSTGGAENVDASGQIVSGSPGAGLNVSTARLINASAASLLWQLSSPVKVSLDRLQSLLDTDPESEDQNKSSTNLVQHRMRRFVVSTPRKNAKEHEVPSGLTTKKRKYNYKLDPPPYMWTYDPTRETVRIWPSGETNPFPWVIANFDTHEKIENHKRVREKLNARPEDQHAHMRGPVPLRHPNGTRIKVKRKYSWMGDDIVSNETMFHRKVCRQVEEYVLANESVSSDESTTPLPATDDIADFTKRMRIRTRAKYHGWTYMTCAPGVSWSPDVYVNSPPSDLFPSSEFDPAGSETIEEYYNAPTPDYNDSIYHLPDDLDHIPDKSKYREIASRTPPREIDVWNTIKSHYESYELYNDYSWAGGTPRKRKHSTPKRRKRFVEENKSYDRILNKEDALLKYADRIAKDNERSIEVLHGKMKRDVNDKNWYNKKLNKEDALLKYADRIAKDNERSIEVLHGKI